MNTQTWAVFVGGAGFSLLLVERSPLAYACLSFCAVAVVVFGIGRSARRHGRSITGQDFAVVVLYAAIPCLVLTAIAGFLAGAFREDDDDDDDDRPRRRLWGGT